MFGLITGLTKAVVGAVVETPIAVVKDVATLGGTLTDQKQTYTEKALGKVADNLDNATKPE